MIPLSSSLLLFFKVMHNGHSNCLQTKKTTTLITANLMCGWFASAARSAKYFIFSKITTLILQKLTWNIHTAYFRHLRNTCLEMTQLRRIVSL